MTVVNTKVLVSQYVSRFLSGYAEGEILLATSKGIYIQLNGQVLLLTSQAYGTVPIGIGIPNFQRTMSPLHPEPGQPVRYFDSQLEFPGGVLKLDLQIQPSSPPSVELLPQYIEECAVLLWNAKKSKGISGLSGPLLLQNEAPVSEMNIFSQKACLQLSELIQALQSEQDVSSSVNKLMGLGVGLTPSGDDVLLGMLYCLLRAAPHWRSTELLRSAVHKLAPTATHPISAAYLVAVAEGTAYCRLDDMLRMLSGQLPLDILPVLEIGSSSGSEMLLGILIAAQIITNRRSSLCSTSN